MKKHYYSFLAFFLSFLFIFPCNVYASGGSNRSPLHPEYKRLNEDYESFIHNSDMFFRIITAVTGAVFNSDAIVNAGQYLHETIIDDLEFASETEYFEWTRDRFLGDDSDNPTMYFIDDELKSALISAVDSYKNKCDNEQVFSWLRTTRPVDVLYATSFPTMDDWNYMKSELESYCSKYNYVSVTAWTEGYAVLSCYTVSQLGIVNKYPYINWDTPANTQFLNATTIDCPTIFINYRDHIKIIFSGYKEFNDYIYGANGQERHFNEVYKYGGQPNYAQLNTLPPYKNESLPWGTAFKGNFLLTHDGGYVRNFKTLDDLKNFQAGTFRPPYYTCDPTLSGNTITAQQLNNGVNYGDIIGGDKYIITPGPGNPIIINPPSPDPGDGGGGSDPSPYPGGGGGGGSDPLPGWDFSDLLKGLMSLIQSIFNLISSLVGYIAQLLGDLINTVTGLVDRLKLLITGGVMELFTAFFPWLPPEVASLISLSFLLGVVIAVIKFIRG